MYISVINGYTILLEISRKNELLKYFEFSTAELNNEQTRLLKSATVLIIRQYQIYLRVGEISLLACLNGSVVVVRRSVNQLSTSCYCDTLRQV